MKKFVTAKHVIRATPFPLIPKQKVVQMPKLSTDTPSHYKLILQKNADFNHKHTVRVISDVITNMSVLEAQDKATEAFVTGKSLLRICPEEIAFLWCKKISDQDVKTIIEPIDFF